MVLPKHKVSRYLLSPSKSATIAAVLSINNPGERPPSGFHRVARRMCLEFHDATSASEGVIVPEREDIRRIIAFAPGLRDAQGTVLVHCEAGISRSSAAVIILAAALLGPEREKEALEVALVACPEARPNRLMIRLADEALQLNGILMSLAAARFGG
jgi:predicted protein tyrosine phosphatase